MLLSLLLWCASALALDGNDRLELELDDGTVVRGWFYSVDTHEVTLSGDNRFVSVPLDAIIGVERDEGHLALEVFREEVRQILADEAAWIANPPPHPHPAVVVGLSMLWAGAGHAALGEWEDFKGYSILEVVVLSTAAYNLYRNSSIGVLFSLGALDVLFRVYAAGESLHLTRSRRARLGIE